MKKFTDIVLNETQKIDDDQLKKGIKVESEHGDIYEQLKEWMDKTYKEYSTMPWSKEEFYGKIAKAHLREIPDYYKRLEKMEKEWKKNESKEI